MEVPFYPNVGNTAIWFRLASLLCCSIAYLLSMPTTNHAMVSKHIVPATRQIQRTLLSRPLRRLQSSAASQTAQCRPFTSQVATMPLVRQHHSHYLLYLTSLAPIFALAAYGNHTYERKQEEKDARLFASIRAHNLENLQRAIANNANVNAHDKNGETPLRHAIHANSLDAVLYLIEQGADLEQRSSCGDTPLHLAITMYRYEIVDALCAAGANIHAVSHSTPGSPSPYFLALQEGHLDVLKLLRSYDPDDDIQSRWCELAGFSLTGPTYLLGWQKEVIEYLIKEKPTLIEERDSSGETLLQHVVRADSLLHIKGFCPWVIERYLEIAVKAGSRYTVKHLIEHGAPIDKLFGCHPPLCVAAKWGHSSIIALLLAAGASVNTRDEHYETPLHKAAGNGHLYVVNELVAAGAPIDAPGYRHQTPLERAAERGRLDIVKFLAAKYETRKVSPTWKERALFAAAQGGRLDVATYLVSQGALMNKPICGTKTALHTAAEYGHTDVVEFLAQSNDVDINAIDRDGKTPLHKATVRGHVDVVACLVTATARIDTFDNHGNIPLHDAIQKGNAKLVWLLATDNTVSIKNKAGFTPLQQALRTHTLSRCWAPIVYAIMKSKMPGS